MSRPIKGTVAAVLLVCAAMPAGCARFRVAPAHAAVAAPETISIHQLAVRLNLRVVRAGAASASLRNKANSVTLFADPGGGAFVNGRQVPGGGAIADADGAVLVPVSLAGAIASALRPVPPRPRPARLRRRPVEPEPPKSVVVIDPGHGGKDPGMVTVNGILEKRVVLHVARAVRQRLVAAGVAVVMTRADDRFIELEERARIANRAGADLFVSIHADSAPNRSARGHTIYVARAASGESLAAADKIDARLAGMGVHSRGVRRANFRVLVKTTCPAVLVEVGYLSNRAEARKLASSSYRSSIADAVAAGVLAFLGR